jgi:hypothetical protein
MPGQIIPGGERTWLVRIFLGRDPGTGKRRYESHTVHGSKRDAQKSLTEALAKLDRGEHAVGASRVLIHALLDDLLADYHINGIDEKGVERQRCEVHIRPYFGSMRAARLGTTEIRRYIEKRRTSETRNGRVWGPATNATINRELALLRRALRLATRMTRRFWHVSLSASGD